MYNITLGILNEIAILNHIQLKVMQIDMHRVSTPYLIFAAMVLELLFTLNTLSMKEISSRLAITQQSRKYNIIQFVFIENQKIFRSENVLEVFFVFYLLKKCSLLDSYTVRKT